MSTPIELSVKDFVNYCKSRGNDKIDNESWGTCAIGTYLLSKGMAVDCVYDIGTISGLVTDEHKAIVQAFEVNLGLTEISEPVDTEMEWDEREDLAEYLNLSLAETYNDIYLAAKI